MKVSCVAEMRQLDATAIETYGLADALLMENAGLAACAVLRQKTEVGGKRTLIFCGGGNNGGDGLAMARILHSNGARVTVFLLSDPAKFKGAARLNFNIAAGLPIEMKRLETVDSARTDVAHADILVDAMLGTGLTRNVGGLYRAAIDLINHSGKPVLSVDIPSGVHGDTGRVMGAAVQAAWTVTFGLPKIGNLLYPGYQYGGELVVSHISFPPEMIEAAGLKIAVNRPPPLPPRPVAGHKGTFGDALFVAGAAGYFGAPCFAALSFMKAGGGYARLAAPRSITPFIAGKGSEIVFLPQQETAAGSISAANKADLLAWAAKVDMVVIGPGLSLDPETQNLVCELSQSIEKPLLIDGDGLTAIARHRHILNTRPAETALTPHLGEMARLTGLPVADIKADTVGVVQRAAVDLRATIVLKGAHSLIGYPDGRVFINTSGNSGMATAGSGDVLAGTIAAMFGLGLPLPQAVCKGVFMHGLAGDLAAAEVGQDGMTAQTILDYLPAATRLDRAGLPDALRSRYGVTVWG